MPEGDRLVRQLRYAGALVLLTMGAGFLFGPGEWRSSPGFYVITAAHVEAGMRVWGAVFLLLGSLQVAALLERRWDIQRVLAIIGAGITAGWAMAFVMAIPLHKLTGISGIPMWSFFSFAQAIQARRIQKRAR